MSTDSVILMQNEPNPSRWLGLPACGQGTRRADRASRVLKRLWLIPLHSSLGRKERGREKPGKRSGSRSGSRSGGLRLRLETSRPDLRVMQVLQNAQVMRVGEGLTVH